MATEVAEPSEIQSAIKALQTLEDQAKEHKRLSGVHRRRARSLQQQITKRRSAYARLGIDLQMAQTKESQP